MLERFKAHASILVIGMLTIVVLYQGITSRKYQSDIERTQRQLNADIDTARAAEQDALAKLGKLQTEYNTLKSTINSVSGGLNGATIAATNSSDLIGKLKSLIGQLPKECK